MILSELLFGSRRRRAVALGWTFVIPPIPPAIAAQSPFKPVTVQSCAPADSLLGPIGDDRRSIVRAYYSHSIDSTRLVAGPERGYRFAEQRAPLILAMTSYRGHTPTTYPHADFAFTIFGADAAAVARPTGVPVVLTLDESSFQLDSLVAVPSQSPVGMTVYINLQVAPNFFFALAGARRATFQIGKVRANLSPRELQDVRGMYRVALCGVPDAR